MFAEYLTYVTQTTVIIGTWIYIIDYVVKNASKGKQ